MFPCDVERGELVLPDDDRPLDLRPRQGDVVRVELETTRAARYAFDGIVLETAVRGWEQPNRSAVWEVEQVWVLFAVASGELAGEWLGEFLLAHRANERIFSLTDLTPATANALTEDQRNKFGRYAAASAPKAATSGDHQAVIEICSRAIERTTTAYRGTLLFLRATARAALGDHAAAVADWDTLLLANADHHGALVGRARSRIALGQRGPAIADLQRAVELGVAGAADLLLGYAPPPPPSNRVHHATYGDGTIVRRLDGDKLEIDFATAGKKTLLARFVKPIP